MRESTTSDAGQPADAGPRAGSGAMGASEQPVDAAPAGDAAPDRDPIGAVPAESTAERAAGETGAAAPRQRLRRMLLGSAAMLISVNIWTGAPLFAVWIGSRVAPASGASMGALLVVLLVLIGSVIALTIALARVNAAYDRLTGRNQGAARRVAPWLRSVRAERNRYSRERTRSSPMEQMLMLSVVAAVIAFEVWFFFFAHYAVSGL